jgi:nicotinate phosphoribosyltransferase
VLYIVRELYFRRFDQDKALLEARKRLAAKLEALREFGWRLRRKHPFEFFDFGVRRRFSGTWQEESGSMPCQGNAVFKGMFTVRLAVRYRLVPIGTACQYGCRH